MEGQALYTEEERRVVWAQMVDALAKTQEDYDSSIRTLAAGGVAVTVSLATALHHVGWRGTTAVVLFLLSLGVNLLSYVTAQKDMYLRLDLLAAHRDSESGSNRWTKWTSRLNLIAGLTLLAGGGVLTWFVSSAT